MLVKNNVDLKPYNTFFISANSKDFAEIESVSDLQELYNQYNFKRDNFFVLGEGSNTLFSSDYDGLVLKMSISGRDIVGSDKEGVTFKFGAGELWRDIVIWISKQDLSGVENMANIPGTIGGAAVGNIAAYGQVFEDVFVELEAFDLDSGKIISLTRKDMGFKYRHSNFKTVSKGRYIIVSVTLKCSTKAMYATDFHSRYKNEQLSLWLEKTAVAPYSPLDIVNGVTSLRKYKLPWMDKNGTCGSFFENPFVTVEKYKELSEKVVDLQQYPVDKMDYSRENWNDTGDDEVVKIPAGRLLDELGWKGKWIGNVGTFDVHALCVITNKKASGSELIEYTNKMKESVKEAFGVELKSEVVIV